MQNKIQLPEELLQKAAALKESLQNCRDPELLTYAAKVIRKQIPYRYRRYAIAWLLLKECTKPVAQNKTLPAEAPKKTKKPQPVTDGFVNLFVNVGKRNKITASDLSRHFGKILDIPLTKIAAVRILPAFSFIEIDAEDAERAIREVSGSTLNKRKIKVSYSTKK